MDWGSVGGAALIGGLCGLVGSVLGALVAKLFPEKHRRMVMVVFVVIFITAGPRLIQPMLQQPMTGEAFEAELMRNPDLGPVTAAWKRADPTSFAVALEQIRTAIDRGTPHDQAVNEFRVTLQAAAGPRFANFSDEQTLAVAAMARDQYLELARSHPSSCHPLFNGAPFGDITPYLSQTVLARERDLLRQAFEAPPERSTNVTPPNLMPAAIDNVLDQLETRVGNDVGMLAPNALLAGREARYCEVVAEFFNVVLAKPPAEGAAFLRRLRMMS